MMRVLLVICALSGCSGRKLEHAAERCMETLYALADGGSAWRVSATELVTAGHALKGLTRGSPVEVGAGRASVRGSLLWHGRSGADLGLLDLPRPSGPALLLGSARLGQEVLVCAAPRGVRRVSRGMISRLAPGLIEVDALVAAGASGGAILDEHGKALGILTQSDPPFAWGLPSTAVAAGLEELRR